jgi:phosphoribosylglycinamide formyltransferase-1
MKKIGVLISGGGTNLQAVIEAVEDGRIPAKISIVISDRKNAYGLVRAEKYGIPSCYISKKGFADAQAFNQAILDKLLEYQVDYIVLAGYLSILSKDLVEHYKNRIINIHPSLIPSFCGMGFYGSKVHQAVIDYGVKVTGATVHFVDEGADTGPIIMQKPVMVHPEDDADSLASRVLEVEHEILPKAVELLVSEKLEIDGRKVIIKE